MKSFLLKIWRVVPIYALSIICGTALTVGLRLLLRSTNLISNISEGVIEVILPLLFYSIFILLVFKRQLRFIGFKKKQAIKRNVLFIPLWILVCTSAIVFQKWYTAASGEISKQKHIETKSENFHTRYYQIENYYPYKEYSGLHAKIYTSSSGRYSRNNRLNFEYYIVTPINANNKFHSAPEIWMGKSFKKTISNALSDQEKEKELNDFENHVFNTMDTINLKSHEYLEKVPNSSKRKNYTQAILNRLERRAKNHSFTILEQHFTPFENRMGKKLEWSVGLLSISFLYLLIYLVFGTYNTSENARRKNKKEAKLDEIDKAIHYLIPKGNHLASSLLINLNLSVFLAMLLCGADFLNPDTDTLIKWGGNIRSLTASGELWRLISYQFVHLGFEHLVLNIFGLVIGAIYLEPILGKWKFITLYLVSGISGGLLSILFKSNIVSVGASGAIFGLYGAALILLLTKAYPQEKRQTVFTLIGLFVILNLTWGIFGNVDNACHIGGLIGGSIIGLNLYFLNKKE